MNKATIKNDEKYYFDMAALILKSEKLRYEIISILDPGYMFSYITQKEC